MARGRPEPAGVFAALVQTSAPHPEARALDLLDRAACADSTFPKPVFTWLRDALREYVAAGGARDLAACLGVKVQPGARSLPRRLAETKRNMALAKIWRLQSACEALSDWRRSELVAESLAEFADSQFLVEWKIGGGPPSGTSELRRALFEAWNALDKPPPTSTAGVYESLKRAGVLA